MTNDQIATIYRLSSEIRTLTQTLVGTARDLDHVDLNRLQLINERARKIQTTVTEATDRILSEVPA